jgi:hypothetical protein
MSPSPQKAVSTPPPQADEETAQALAQINAQEQAKLRDQQWGLMVKQREQFQEEELGGQSPADPNPPGYGR